MIYIPIPILVKVYLTEQSEVCATPWSASVHWFGLVKTLPVAALNVPAPDEVNVIFPVGGGFPPPAPEPTTVAVQVVVVPGPIGSGVQVTVVVVEPASVNAV